MEVIGPIRRTATNGPREDVREGPPELHAQNFQKDFNPGYCGLKPKLFWLLLFHDLKVMAISDEFTIATSFSSWTNVPQKILGL